MKCTWQSVNLTYNLTWVETAVHFAEMSAIVSLAVPNYLFGSSSTSHLVQKHFRAFQRQRSLRSTVAEIENTTKSELHGCRSLTSIALLQPAGERCDRVKLSCSCCMQFIKLVLSKLSLQEDFLNWSLWLVWCCCLVYSGFAAPFQLRDPLKWSLVQTCSSTSHLNVSFAYVGVHAVFAVLNSWVK
ncbi:uncharacterized protein LOC124329210 isoform X2 [Daphnia pulicaria]|uniref:uncharacterized protein LOC124329210 isoform X2 n=1 Tax=Daphnia pulicaria TaxID=35523 RepID=UPI001EEBE7F4|nr:uncharacterized protein LOC124329210 isoform X2 [Daphnia pulicaria]